MKDSADRISSMRLYGAVIALVSGLYSAYLSVTGMEMTLGAWFMLLLGVVVIAHGIVLLTPAAERLGQASGPLMIAYSVLMLLNQVRMAAGIGDGMMNGGMNDGMNGGMGMDSGAEMAMTMGTDAGMVSIAVLMLASGLIMTVRSEMMSDGGM